MTTNPFPTSLTSKVPQVTLAFWLIKIATTTLGETAGDAVSMTLKLGYAIGTAIFFAFFLVAVTAQVRAKTFHRFLYWTVIVATTTVGTTMADFSDRSLGIGYAGGSLILFAGLMIVLALWRFTLGTVSVASITTPKAEIFYWVTILFSNTLGTALGDYLSDGIGFDQSAMVFGSAIVAIALLYFYTDISHTALFWMAFILTRPLGASLGDILTKPLISGGLNLGRFSSSLAIAVFMVGCIVLSERSAREPTRV